MDVAHIYDGSTFVGAARASTLGSSRLYMFCISARMPSVYTPSSLLSTHLPTSSLARAHVHVRVRVHVRVHVRVRVRVRVCVCQCVCK